MKNIRFCIRLIAGIFFSLAVINSQIKQLDLYRQIEDLIESSGFSNSLVGLEIYNLTDSSLILAKDNDKLMRPASNVKLLTSSAGLLFLGQDYEFKTKVFKVGEIKDSVLFGSLFIKGEFDPSFNSENLDTLVLNIKRSGINEIRGNLFIDLSAMDSLRWGAGWMWDDDPSTDAPRLTPLCINHNSVKVVVSPGNLGRKVNISIIPVTNYFQVENKTLTTDYFVSKLKVTRDWMNNSDKIIISGSVFSDSGPDTTEINIANPTNYFQSLIKEKMNERNIVLRGITDTLTTLFYADSLFTLNTVFDQILDQLNKKSDNLYAEMTLRAIGLKFSGPPSSARKGLKIVDDMIFIASGDSTNYKLVDGSGLSHYNLLSNNILISVIKYLYNNYPQLYTRLKNSLSVSGTDGTMKNRLTDEDLKGKVFAKTGSLSAVSTITGIIESGSGDEIAFSIFVNNYTSKGSAARVLQDKIIKMIDGIN